MQEERTGVNVYAPNRRDRRLLARHKISPCMLGRAYNRLPANPRPPIVAPEPGQDDKRFDGRAMPRNASEWEDWVRGIETPEDFGKRFKSGEFQAALNSYANNREKERQEMLSQLREQFEASWTEFLQAHRDDLSGVVKIPDMDELKAKHGARPARALNNPLAKGAPLNGIWPDFYTYLQDVWYSKGGNGAFTAEAQERMRAYNSYSERVPSEGGFLVPEEFRSQLMQLSLESAIVRPNATVIPMANPRLHIPTVDETSRVSSIKGGVIVYRTEEGAELTESAAAFSSIKLDVTKQTALSHVPNELIRDWAAFGAFMDATLPDAMAFYEDLDWISGSGVGAPLGALNAANTALLVISGQTGQTTSTIVWENIIAMYARMLPSSIGSAQWLASPDTFAQLATMALSVGTGGSAVWLTDGRNEPQLTLLGRPVRMSEKAPAALGSQGALSFVDWSQYLIGDYQTMTVDSSPHVKFTSDKTSFRAIARNDGRPWLQSAITPHNNSATLSPYITLAAI
jgi:HK97 family phage major capsid protein